MFLDDARSWSFGNGRRNVLRTGTGARRFVNNESSAATCDRSRYKGQRGNHTIYFCKLLRVTVRVNLGWWGNFAGNGYSSFVPYYVVSAELVGALLLIPGIYTRWAAIYAAPMMFGAAHFWLVRKGFYFAAAGGELPIVWGVMLIVQAMLGDGIWAARASDVPILPRSGRRAVGS